MTRLPIGGAVIRRETVTSTMDEALVLAEQGASEGTIIVADYQTAGRGRAGRPWAVNAGDGLLLSVIIRPEVAPDRLSRLPLLVSVAVAEALEETAPVSCQLKWPNDVWIEGKKVAGILISVHHDADQTPIVIVGIGININAPPDSLPEGATSLAAVTARDYDRDNLLEVLTRRLEAAYQQFAKHDGVADLGDWRRRAALVGERVRIVQGHETLIGVYRGIDEGGALLLETPGGGVRRIVSGDLVRGPVSVS
ncbi:MAG TPA: biotin--[acetyl-CoA-carboxylase] ligase [Thermomicrobiales bacterium]|nr:biotin--[acetyl-CoA-carboxylase] ligase [Thermomicrobiales bacterium]